MEVKFMPKIQETQNGMFVYLPKAFTTLLNWNKGDTLAIFPSSTEKGTLLMKKTIDANETKKQIPLSSTNIIKETTPHTQTLTKTFTPYPRIDPKRFSFLRQQ